MNERDKVNAAPVHRRCSATWFTLIGEQFVAIGEPEILATRETAKSYLISRPSGSVVRLPKRNRIGDEKRRWVEYYGRMPRQKIVYVVE